MTTTKQKIKNLKNFGSIDQSFKKWLTTCPKDYIWEINEVTRDQATFTFRRTLTFRRINEHNRI